MTYIILTEPKRSSEPPMKRQDIYWSKTNGSFSGFLQATKFSSFEEAQPVVKELRKHNPFVHAVRLEDVVL